MKNIVSRWLLSFCACALIFGCSDDFTPKEGEQFTTLPANLATYRIAPVAEVFSLTCSHCRKMESVLPELEMALQQEVGKVHVTFNEGAKAAAMVYYSAMMQLGQKPDAKLMDALFSAIQDNAALTPEQQQAAIEKVFTDNNLISPSAFDQKQRQDLGRRLKIAQAITEQGQIQAVPTFIVAGRYQVLTSGHDDIKELAETINYLLHKH